MRPNIVLRAESVRESTSLPALIEAVERNLDGLFPLGAEKVWVEEYVKRTLLSAASEFNHLEEHLSPCCGE